ncbi:MAG TPA: TatD family hydrolase, partial [Candidatus Cloacimonadota bacterium]|nr:TatD family hydrolase [Candidatus Cloacimonadota bacterium]
REHLIKQCRQEDIINIIDIGYNKETSENATQLAEKYDFIYATVGYHPHDASDYQPDVIKQLARHKKVVAIGEIGLDLFRNISPIKTQKEVFEDQIILSLEYDLPVVIHDRDAHEDCYNLLKKHNLKNVVFHCFSGDVIFAEKLLKEGWKMSFTGNITYNNPNLHDVIRMLPEDSFFVETDCPYLSPLPLRGKRNSPLNLHLIVGQIADIRMQTPKEIAEITTRNALKFFNIPEPK